MDNNATHPFDDAEKTTRVAMQLREIKQGRVTCVCGLQLPHYYVFRCLYCGEWYCQKCAESHFGKTREQYKAEMRNNG